MTTQLQWQEATDIVLQPQTSNGIKKTSLVRLSKLATVDRKLIVGIIGSLNKIEMTELNVKLKLIFQLP
ncbi:type II toxin-antitoxin system PemK/MazF family toxin [Mucilaginibacter sp. X5P1]|uniref:type II toxin-antitoxin system PemK/MazF family toxin n=1 Tax=Mucilaginibacter sp. X5P1 TaxID=2723088 RepID=UPI00351BFEEF